MSYLPTVGLLAFLAGVGSVWGYGRLCALASAGEEVTVPAPPVGEISDLLRDPRGRVNEDGIAVKFLRTEDRGGELFAVFLVTNDGPEEVGYVDYFYRPGGIPGKRIRQGGRVFISGRECATGMGFIPFRPGETLTYVLSVPDRAAAFEAGFDYAVMLSRTPEVKIEGRTAWSETISPPE